MKNKNKGFSAEYYLINDILMDWNPLNVDGPIKDEEYSSIIPNLIKIKKDKNDLISFLKEILDKRYGISYKEKELYDVANSIYKLR